MDICEDTLKKVEEFAYGLLSIEETCIVMQWEVKNYLPLFNQENHPVALAYKKGRLLLQYEINMDNIKFAKQGNAHSMSLLIKRIEELSIDEKKSA